MKLIVDTADKIVTFENCFYYRTTDNNELDVIGEDGETVIATFNSISWNHIRRDKEDGEEWPEPEQDDQNKHPDDSPSGLSLPAHLTGLPRIPEA